MLHVFMKYTLLNVLGMIGLSCYILADTFFVSKGLGPEGLTALNLAIPVYSFIHGGGLMIGMGGATRYSILKSRGEKKNADRVFTQAVLLSVSCSAVLFVIGLLFSNQIATLLGADSTVHSMTNTYLKVIMLFAPMFMMNNVLLCFIRNDGNPQLAMVAMLGGSFSNIVLDYVFIFPCDMGMFGAVFATGLAPVISMMILSSCFLRKKQEFHMTGTGLTLHTLSDICALGATSLITEVSAGIVMIIFNMLILKLMGNMGVAAYGVIANLSLVVVAVFTGISQGIQPLISSNFGSGNKANIRSLYRYALIFAGVFSVIVYVICCVFASPIVSIFNSEQNLELQTTAVYGLRLYATAFLLIGFNVITATYFSSTDQPKPSFCISALRGFIIIIPTAFLLSSLFGMTGVWLVLLTSESIVAVTALILYKRLSL